MRRMEGTVISVVVAIIGASLLLLIRHKFVTKGKSRRRQSRVLPFRAPKRTPKHSNSEEEKHNKSPETRFAIRKRAATSHLSSTFAIILLFTVTSTAQQLRDNRPVRTSYNAGEGASAIPATKTSNDKDRASGITEREQLLLQRIDKLEQRLAELESRTLIKASAELQQPLPMKITDAAPSIESLSSNAVSSGATGVPVTEEDRSTLDCCRNTTLNLIVDGYYGYNFNHPIGGINLLRAYDVSHNSFSLNQAAIVIEQAPKVEAGRRFGFRLDLQYGQATETVQGNANNELRPQAYRPIWQAYGSYVAPVGKGLTVDFGKFAGSLGYETNYTKDNYNYSRAYFFNFLPFYHFGFRTRYPVNDKLAVMYHLMNGAQQAEDFNRFKSHHIALILTPQKRVTWQVNYYVGREQRDVAPILNSTFPSLPTQPGLPVENIRPSPRGKLHVLDTYATWNATDNLTLAAEADYVVNRVEDFSPPSRVVGGTLYARYQFTPLFGLAGRAEYLSDRGGLFSGVTQALKETTLTADFRLVEGFLVRGEWRRDFSNQEFFLTDAPGIRKSEQTTATVGLVWWFGRKQGAW